MAETPGPPRPPPLPPTLPRRVAPRPTPGPSAEAEQATGAAGRPPIDMARVAASARARPEHVWSPPPTPPLAREARPLDTFSGLLPPPRGSLLNNQLAWVGLIGWGFILVMVLLVVSPTEAMSALVGPFKQPISAGGYGPLAAIFAVFAVLVAVFGGFLIWLAVSREYDPPPTEPPTPTL